MYWSDEKTARFRELWNAPLSASKIAAELGGFEHCRDGGRSAVLSKAHRLQLAPRAVDRRSPVKRWAQRRRGIHPDVPPIQVGAAR